MAALLADHLPDVDLVRLDDIAHWPQLEAPDVVRAQLRRILSEHL
jgi:pimeloyl-ACP methyl ester carboxylesterase